ncbi:unnamed protein product [Ectocarpus sp. CCAP 1310/34]|nr:unnamed protein product [Ectocarpus sp. CCAP 1310/34]
MDVWRLSSVALLVFRPALSVASMKHLTTAPFRKDVQSELKATTATVVSLMSMLIGEQHRGRLCSNHQGLHFAKNATPYVVIRVQTSKQQDAEKFNANHGIPHGASLLTASGRDNEEHIVRRENDATAAEVMAEGARWTAWRDDKTMREWVKKTVQASPSCRELLRAISEWEIGTRTAPGDHGESLSGTPVSGNRLRLRAQRWQEKIGALLRRTGQGGLNLLDLYKAWFSCGREKSNPNMSENGRCPRCWRNRHPHTVNMEGECSNTWIGAPERVSGGLCRMMAFSRRSPPGSTTVFAGHGSWPSYA